MKIVNVVLKKSTKAFDIEYSYKADDEIASGLARGSLVKIPFGKSDKLVDAYVREIIEPENYTGRYPVDSFKYIISGNKNQTKDISPEFMALANWMSRRYFCSRAAALKNMTAPGNDEITGRKVRKANLILSPEELSELIQNRSIKRIYQIDVLEYLRDNGETEVSELLTRFSISPAVLNTLSKNCYISIAKVEKELEVDKGVKYQEYIEPNELTGEQQNAVDQLKCALNSWRFAEYLLHGVTGSGKTEIYLNIINEAILHGKQAIVLVPEISLTPQMNQRFKGRFGNNVAILHSRLTARERYDQWQLIKQGKVKLVVGARSAVFAPFSNLGVIIIDEEHEGTYKSENTPKYHASEIAAERCRYNNALLIYGSATPSIETSYRVQTKQIGYIKLKQRASGVEMPEVILVDMKQEYENGNRGIISDVLCNELERNLKNKEQTMILINKRGFSSAIICKNCNYSPKCPDCNTFMTYHTSNERVICHYCGYTEKVRKVCPECSCDDLKQTGVGTQRAEKMLKELFPEAKTIRMDMDTTKGRNSHEEILSRFVKERIDILIGTQMIAKGHDFDKVTLVGILSADSGLNLEDFRASERTFQLITQAAGRSGRSKDRGRVVIQSGNIDDYTIISASQQDYRHFYTRETFVRKQLDFPPFTNMAVVGLSGQDDKHVYDAAVYLKEILCRYISDLINTDVQVLGPARFPMSKINGKYRWRLILKCKDREKLIDLCTDCLKHADNKFFKNISGPAIDINPMNML